MLENLWEKLGKKKKEDPLAKEPAFEDMKAALPIDLQDEFQNLGNKMQKLAGDGDFGEKSYREKDLSPEDREVEKRYDELMALARKNYFGAEKEK